MQFKHYFLHTIDGEMELPDFTIVFAAELCILLAILVFDTPLHFFKVVVQLEFDWDLPNFEHALHTSLRVGLHPVEVLDSVDVAHHVYLHHEAVFFGLHLFH